MMNSIYNLCFENSVFLFSRETHKIKRYPPILWHDDVKTSLKPQRRISWIFKAEEDRRRFSLGVGSGVLRLHAHSRFISNFTSHNIFRMLFQCFFLGSDVNRLNGLRTWEVLFNDT